MAYVNAVKAVHEIRDPIHVFVKLDAQERAVVDSRFFQRLRHIHQLALTYLVYPGATHKRFEHSLGVMELAGRVFDVITNPDNVTDEIRKQLDPLKNASEADRSRWRRTLRLAALCHDIGHLPFSHAAEKELLPEGWDHERLSYEVIMHPDMQAIWREMSLYPEDIAKLALGRKKGERLGLEFSPWEEILSEIIVGDAFGVDRMDYLLRDSHHLGVAYGRFDHYRLIDTLRILPKREQGSEDRPPVPVLGVEEGGLQSAEALLLARYFMYSQVYFHPVRRIYDIHLKDFLTEWLPNGQFPTDLDKLVTLTDNEVLSGLLASARKGCRKGHVHAKRIRERQHFKVLYERNPTDVERNEDAGAAVYRAAVEKFGAEHVRHDSYRQKGGVFDFPVLRRNGEVVSALALSDTLKNLPLVSVDYVFVSRDKYDVACRWLKREHDRIIEKGVEEEDDETATEGGSADQADR
ncbi:MAG: HD domain-containing protein [Rhodothalassiaceae bacterium]|nr:MAG: HD domain-containing protein [Rhodothalassiaceae bacterium]